MSGKLAYSVGTQRVYLKKIKLQPLAARFLQKHSKLKMDAF